MNLQDYYLVKLFKKNEYRYGFDSGSYIRINSMKSFWNIENPFQQDYEGKVFGQTGRGFLFAGNPNFGDKLKNYSSIEEIITDLHNNGTEVSETTDMTIRVDGYIVCFYLLPRKSVQFENNRMMFNDDNEKTKFSIFLQRYYKENGAFYGSIYNSEQFCNIFFKIMKSHNYRICYGKVTYLKISSDDKIRWLQNGELKKIVFTKPESYSYQNEFRIFLMADEKNDRDYIEEKAYGIHLSVIGQFDNNSFSQ